MTDETAQPAAQQIARRVARFNTFATLGVLGTTQDLIGACLEHMDGADPEVVAEETLVLVATATARAAEVGLREEPGAQAVVVEALLDLPFLYRDYLVGGAVLAQQNPSLADAGDEVYHRLQRKRDFYTVHLPPNQFPGERLLSDKMELWMGRVSPPRMPDMPAARLQRLELVPLLVHHLKLVLAYGRKGGGG